MKTTIFGNQLVILADSHNPTLLSEPFITKAGIASEEEIEMSSMVLTPAFSQVAFKDSSTIGIDLNRLVIASPQGPGPFIKGQRYCDALKYIKGTAVGINFDAMVMEFDSKRWFEKYAMKELACIELKFKLKDCTIQVLQGDNSIRITFNYHYNLAPYTLLGDIKIDFVREWEHNLAEAHRVINELFL